jgi:uncharacterized protein (UPF0276 family)
LLPLPFTEQALEHVAARIRQVQDLLGRRILIENVSSYIEFEAELAEHEFLSALSERADCGLLLDVNNVYVSSVNHVFDPREYLLGLPLDRVQQIHLAGHSRQGAYLVDTHDAPVIEPVWELYQLAIARFGAVTTMIERDDNIPPLEELLAELEHAKTLSARAQAKAA